MLRCHFFGIYFGCKNRLRCSRQRTVQNLTTGCFRPEATSRRRTRRPEAPLLGVAARFALSFQPALLIYLHLKASCHAFDEIEAKVVYLNFNHLCRFPRTEDAWVGGPRSSSDTSKGDYLDRPDAAMPETCSTKPPHRAEYSSKGYNPPTKIVVRHDFSCTPQS